MEPSRHLRLRTFQVRRSADIDEIAARQGTTQHSARCQCRHYVTFQRADRGHLIQYSAVEQIHPGVYRTRPPKLDAVAEGRDSIAFGFDHTVARGVIQAMQDYPADRVVRVVGSVGEEPGKIEIDP